MPRLRTPRFNSVNPMPIHSEVAIKVPQLLPVGVDVADIPAETPRGSATQLLVAWRVWRNLQQTVNGVAR